MSDTAQVANTFSRDVIEVRSHLQQRHATATCEGIRVRVPILNTNSDIE